MKKKIISIIVIVILIAIAILSNIDFKEEKKETKLSDAIKFKEEYEELNGRIIESNQKKYLSVTIPKDNVIKYATAKEVVDVVENKTGIIYIGFPECPWCRNAVPVLLNAAAATGVGQIYYLNASTLRDILKLDDNDKIVVEKEAEEGYKELLASLDKILEDYTLTNSKGKEIKTGEKRIYVPLVVFVKDGEITGYHMDTVKSQDDPYVKLNNEQTEELYNIYVDNILKMQGSACDESC